jgi:hypothetical protein
VSSFFDKTNIAGLSGALIYVISFFPFIIVMSLESSLSFSTKSALVRGREEEREGAEGEGEKRDRETDHNLETAKRRKSNRER